MPTWISVALCGPAGHVCHQLPLSSTLFVFNAELSHRLLEVLLVVGKIDNWFLTPGQL